MATIHEANLGKAVRPARKPRAIITAGTLVPVILAFQQVALGANSDWLALLASLSDILGALVVLFLLSPGIAFWRGAWPVLAAIACALAWLAAPALIPALFAGFPPRPAPDLLLPGMARMFGGVALLLAGGWSGYRRGMMKLALNSLTALGFVIILVGVMLRQMDPDHVWGVGKAIMGNRFTGTLLNANADAVLAAITCLLGLSGLLQSLRGRLTHEVGRGGIAMRSIHGLACIAGLAACFATGSRTVLITLALAIAVTAMLDRPLRRLVLSPAGLIMVPIAALLALFFVAVGGEVTIERMGALASAYDLRVEMLGHYASLAMDSPWIGYGPLAFDIVNQRSMGDPAGALTYWYVHAPHNILLTLLLTGGAVYLLLMLLAGLLIAMRVARAPASLRQTPFYRGAILSVLLAILCAMVDIQLDVPAVSGLVLFLSGLVWGRSIRARADRDGG